MAVSLVPTLSQTPAMAAAATCATTNPAGGEWRTYGHDPSNTRSQPAEKTIGPLEAATLAPAWTFSTKGAGAGGDFTGTPVVADGCLFVASSRGWVFALNADTGAVVWKAKVPKGGVNSTVTISGGRAIVAVSNAGAPYLMAFAEKPGTA